MSVRSSRRRRRERRFESVGVVALAATVVVVFVVVGLVGALVGPGPPGSVPVSAQRVPTPEIMSWQRIDEPGGVAMYVLVAEDAGGPSWSPGAAVGCSDGVLRLWAFFGPYPADGSPVQFAARTADGRVERHGPVTRGGRSTGFHDPVVESRPDVLRMLSAVAATDSLVSNGHYAFWNRVSASGNEVVRNFARTCR